MARYAVGDYETWLLIHILCGELLLILAPFTKLSHIILFFMSRAQLGMDYGIKRGGMKTARGWPGKALSHHEGDDPCLKENSATRCPSTTEEALKALLGDTGGKQYYEEMKALEVDSDNFSGPPFRKPANRAFAPGWRFAPTAACAPNSCFLYLISNRDPKQVPAYKIQSTLGEIVKRQGKVDNDFMHMAMETAWAKCTCCNRCGMYCPHGIDMGVMFGYLRGLLYQQGFVPWELKIGAGMHRVYRAQMDVTHEDLAGDLRVDGRRVGRGLPRS
jgi:hypothetical protein